MACTAARKRSESDRSRSGSRPCSALFPSTSSANTTVTGQFGGERRDILRSGGLNGRSLGIGLERLIIGGPALQFRRRAPLPLDLLVEPIRLRLGNRAQLALQQLAADVELSQRRCFPPVTGVKLHERAMHTFLQ